MTQLDAWRGEFGDAYVERNRPDDDEKARLAQVWGHLLLHMNPQPTSILEVGCNVGRNLEALSRVTTASLNDVEPNAAARAEVAVGDVVDGHAGALPYDDGAFELVFTSVVLIHVPQASLRQAYEEIHRVSSRWLLAIEYFAPTLSPVHYRGSDDMLWKRDYGGLWEDGFDVRPVAEGFFSKRRVPMDDTNWWLFEKRSAVPRP